MKTALQVTFRGLPRSRALVSRIEQLTEKLEEFSPSIMRCRVRISLPHAHKSQGKLFDARVDITAPGIEISVVRAHRQNPRHVDPYAALRDAFRAARRKLQDYERRRRLDVKYHSLASLDDEQARL